MGQIFKRKYKYGGKTLLCSTWSIKYYSHGRVIRESTETTDYEEAKDILKRKEGDATRGRGTVSMERKVLFKELADLVEADYKLNGFRSLVDIELRHRLHILPHFGKVRATRIMETDIDRYVLHRREEGARNATINRELATIKRAYSLGIRKKLVSDRPHITMLEEDNVRQGFFEREQLAAITSRLRKGNVAPAEFAYVTGWRKQEVLSLRWPQVDFAAGTVRLEPGTTKNREARQFPMTRELRSILEGQKAKADLLKKAGIITPWVFFKEGRCRRGRPVGEFKHNWETACEEAGLPGRIFHDFRRTAVRNLVRAGVPERVAMKLTGHKTRSVFERYNIVSEGDMRDAAAKLDAFSGTEQGTECPRAQNHPKFNAG